MDAAGVGLWGVSAGTGGGGGQGTDLVGSWQSLCLSREAVDIWFVFFSDIIRLGRYTVGVCLLMPR